MSQSKCLFSPPTKATLVPPSLRYTSYMLILPLRRRGKSQNDRCRPSWSWYAYQSRSSTIRNADGSPEAVGKNEKSIWEHYNEMAAVEDISEKPGRPRLITSVIARCRALGRCTMISLIHYLATRAPRQTSAPLAKMVSTSRCSRRQWCYQRLDSTMVSEYRYSTRKWMQIWLFGSVCAGRRKGLWWIICFVEPPD